MVISSRFQHLQKTGFSVIVFVEHITIEATIFKKENTFNTFQDIKIKFIPWGKKINLR